MGDSNEEGAGFRIHKISVAGAAGALVGIGAIAILVLGVPRLRWALLFAVVAGGVFGAGLVLYRRRQK